MKYKFAISVPATTYAVTWIKANSKEEALKLAEELRNKQWYWEPVRSFEIDQKADLEIEEIEEIDENK